MELCFVQLRLFLMPRSVLIDIQRWNHEYSKHTQTRRHDIYTPRSSKCPQKQTLSCGERSTWFGSQCIGLFRSGSELLQTRRMQSQQMQSTEGQSVTRFPVESQPKTSQPQSGATRRDRSRMVQLRRNNTASSHHSKNIAPITDFEQRRNRRCRSQWEADPHAKQGLVSEDTVSDAQQRSALPVVSLTSESQTNTVSRPTSVAIDCDSSSNGPVKSTDQPKSDRLHSTGRDTTQGAKMLDEDLVQLLQQGQREAFTTLVSKWQDRIFTFCFRQLGEQALAEEATQDVFVKVYTSIHSFRKESKFSTWLYRIATNHCINLNNRHHRRHRDHHQSFDEMHNQPAEEHTPLQQLERRDFEQQLQKALDQLSEEHRALLILRDIQDCSYEEIADITQLNIGTIKSRIHRGRHNLRQILNGGQQS